MRPNDYAPGSVIVHPEFQRAELHSRRAKLVHETEVLHGHIKERKRRIARDEKDNVTDAIAAGLLLLDLQADLKVEVGYGHWMAWARENIHISHRSINVYMSLAEHRGLVSQSLRICDAIDLIEKENKRRKRQQEHDDPPPLPPGKFSLIAADPPWPLSGLPYRTMTLDEIRALPVAERAADDAVLWLWVVDAFLLDAARVIESWGFTYRRRALVWVKDHSAPHPHLPGQHELCLLATRGDPKIRCGPSSVLEAPRGRHSEKPQEFFDRVEWMCRARPTQRLEMFARPGEDGVYPREGAWVPWGDEILTDRSLAAAA